MTHNNWIEHCLTEAERQDFERDGYFLVRDALDMNTVDRVNSVIDRLHQELRGKTGIGPRDQGVLGESDRMNLKDCAVKDPALLDLLHHPTTFPKVFGILGWNIQLYHSQLVLAPPIKADEQDHNLGSWHQDSGRLNVELESNPRPRISLKVGFYMSDNSRKGCGNFCVIPGSHLRNTLDKPADGSDPEGAIQVLAKPGDAVLFDRRIWHRASANHADFDRKIIFYGYSYRWLKPRSDLAISEELAKDLDPIQRQLLSYGGNNMSCTSPAAEDVPLRQWMEDNVPGMLNESAA